MQDVLDELNELSSVPRWHTWRAHAYWLLGTLLPILFVVSLVYGFLVKIRAQQSRARKEFFRSTGWLRKATKALRAREKSESRLKDAGAMSRWYVWPGYQWSRFRCYRYSESKVKKKEQEVQRYSSMADDFTLLDKVQGEVLRSVFKGEWEGVTSRLATRGSLAPFSLGVVAALAAFLLGGWLEGVLRESPFGIGALVADLTTLFAATAGAMATYCLAGWVVRQGEACVRLGSFLWGSSIVVYLALNAVEVSGYSSVNDFFDSQTVTVMFVCLVMLLGLPDAEREVEKKVEQLRGNYPGWIEEVGGFRERLGKQIMNAAYVLLTLHCVGRATGSIIRGEGVDGIVAATSTTVVALLYPLVALTIRDWRERR